MSRASSYAAPQGEIRLKKAYETFGNEARNDWLEQLQQKIRYGVNPPQDPGPSRSPSPFVPEEAEVPVAVVTGTGSLQEEEEELKARGEGEAVEYDDQLDGSAMEAEEGFDYQVDQSLEQPQLPRPVFEVYQPAALAGDFAMPGPSQSAPSGVLPPLFSGNTSGPSFSQARYDPFAAPVYENAIPLPGLADAQPEPRLFSDDVVDPDLLMTFAQHLDSGMREQPLYADQGGYAEGEDQYQDERDQAGDGYADENMEQPTDEGAMGYEPDYYGQGYPQSQPGMEADLYPADEGQAEQAWQGAGYIDGAFPEPDEERYQEEEAYPPTQQADEGHYAQTERDELEQDDQAGEVDHGCEGSRSAQNEVEREDSNDSRQDSREASPVLPPARQSRRAEPERLPEEEDELYDEDEEGGGSQAEGSYSDRTEEDELLEDDEEEEERPAQPARSANFMKRSSQPDVIEILTDSDDESQPGGEQASGSEQEYESGEEETEEEEQVEEVERQDRAEVGSSKRRAEQQSGASPKRRRSVSPDSSYASQREGSDLPSGSGDERSEPAENDATLDPADDRSQRDESASRSRGSSANSGEQIDELDSRAPSPGSPGAEQVPYAAGTPQEPIEFEDSSDSEYDRLDNDAPDVEDARPEGEEDPEVDEVGEERQDDREMSGDRRSEVDELEGDDALATSAVAYSSGHIRFDEEDGPERRSEVDELEDDDLPAAAIQEGTGTSPRHTRFDEEDGVAYDPTPATGEAPLRDFSGASPAVSPTPQHLHFDDAEEPAGTPVSALGPSISSESAPQHVHFDAADEIIEDSDPPQHVHFADTDEVVGVSSPSVEPHPSTNASTSNAPHSRSPLKPIMSIPSAEEEEEQLEEMTVDIDESRHQPILLDEEEAPEPAAEAEIEDVQMESTCASAPSSQTAATAGALSIPSADEEEEMLEEMTVDEDETRHQPIMLDGADAEVPDVRPGEGESPSPHAHPHHHHKADTNPLISVPSADEEEELLEEMRGQSARSGHQPIMIDDEADIPMPGVVSEEEREEQAPATSQSIAEPDSAAGHMATEADVEVMDDAPVNLGFADYLLQPPQHPDPLPEPEQAVREFSVSPVPESLADNLPSEMEEDREYRDVTPIPLPDPTAPAPDTQVPQALEAGDMPRVSRSPSMEAIAPMHIQPADMLVDTVQRPESPIELPDPQAPPPDTHIPAPILPQELEPSDKTPTGSVIVQAPEETPNMPLESAVLSGAATPRSRAETPTDLPDPAAAPEDARLEMPDVPHQADTDHSAPASLIVHAPPTAEQGIFTLTSAAGPSTGRPPSGLVIRDFGMTSPLQSKSEAPTPAVEAGEGASRFLGVSSMADMPMVTPGSEMEVELAMPEVRDEEGRAQEEEGTIDVEVHTETEVIEEDSGDEGSGAEDVGAEEEDAADDDNVDEEDEEEDQEVVEVDQEEDELAEEDVDLDEHVEEGAAPGFVDAEIEGASEGFVDTEIDLNDAEDADSHAGEEEEEAEVGGASEPDELDVIGDEEQDALEQEEEGGGMAGGTSDGMLEDDDDGMDILQSEAGDQDEGEPVTVEQDGNEEVREAGQGVLDSEDGMDMLQSEEGELEAAQANVDGSETAELVEDPEDERFEMRGGALAALDEQQTEDEAGDEDKEMDEMVEDSGVGQRHIDEYLEQAAESAPIASASGTREESPAHEPLRHHHHGSVGPRDEGSTYTPSNRRAQRQSRQSLSATETAVTRSHCTYRKLRIIENDISADVLVPQCVLGDTERMGREESVDLGDPTLQEQTEARKQRITHDNPLLSAALAAKLHRVAGAAIFDDGHCFLLSTSAGGRATDEIREKTPHSTPRRVSRGRQSVGDTPSITFAPLPEAERDEPEGGSSSMRRQSSGSGRRSMSQASDAALSPSQAAGSTGARRTSRHTRSSSRLSQISNDREATPTDAAPPAMRTRARSSQPPAASGSASVHFDREVTPVAADYAPSSAGSARRASLRSSKSVEPQPVGEGREGSVASQASERFGSLAVKQEATVPEPSRRSVRGKGKGKAKAGSPTPSSASTIDEPIHSSQTQSRRTNPNRRSVGRNKQGEASYRPSTPDLADEASEAGTEKDQDEIKSEEVEVKAEEADIKPSPIATGTRKRGNRLSSAASSTPVVPVVEIEVGPSRRATRSGKRKADAEEESQSLSQSQGDVLVEEEGKSGDEKKEGGEAPTKKKRKGWSLKSIFRQ